LNFQGIREGSTSVWFGLAIRAAIMLILFSIGLQTNWAKATFLFRQPVLLNKSLVVRNVAMPLIAILLAKTFPVHSPVKGAIALLSITPVPPVWPAALVKAGARASYVSGLLVSHSVLPVVLVPVTVS
jgi:bile acid:Na+ symporter, BASS family